MPGEGDNDHKVPRTELAPGSGSEETETTAGVEIEINTHAISPESQLPGGEFFKEDASKTNYIIVHFTDLPNVEQEKTLKDLKVQFVHKVPPNTWLARYEPKDLAPVRQLPFVIYANPVHESLSLTPGLEAKLAVHRKSEPGSSSVRHGVAAAAAAAAAAGLRALNLASPPSTSQPKPSPGPTASEFHDVYIQPYRGAMKPQQLRDHLISRLGIPQKRLALELIALRGRLTADEIKKVAKFDEVFRVEDVGNVVMHNHLARDIVGVPTAVARTAELFPSTAALDGAGEIIVVCDSGLDKGVKTGPDAHPFFAGRVLHLDPRSNATGKDTSGNDYSRKGRTDDLTGHGTHVAGIACGSGSGLTPQPAIRLLDGRLDGVAPGASLVMQAILNCPTYDPQGNVKVRPAIDPAVIPGMGSTDPDSDADLSQAAVPIHKVFMDPYYGYPTDLDKNPETTATVKDCKARIHNCSWGKDLTLDVFLVGYDTPATIIDAMVHEARDYFLVRSAGNQGDTDLTPENMGQIHSWAAAKNSITVGACYSSQYVKTSGPGMLYASYLPRNEGGVVMDCNDVTRLSSRGPPEMMRSHRQIIKPDVVAPGVAIYSAGSRARVTTNSLGTAPDFDPLCAFSTGSSMAAPMVAGCAALLRQALKKKNFLAPSAALLKAFVVNGAKDLSRVRGVLARGNRTEVGGSNQLAPMPIGPAPDNFQGWGRLDVAESVDNVINSTFAGFVDVKLVPDKCVQNPVKPLVADLTPSDNRCQTVKILGAAGRKANFKATLAYTDVYGAGLQNELTLGLEFDLDPRLNIAASKRPDTTKSFREQARLERIANNNVQKLEVRDINLPVGSTMEVTMRVTVINVVSLIDDVQKAMMEYALVWKIWYTSDDPE
ncbi:peptidase S8/S53 domain-containing protein [Apodospora peruviana]|uniref:Peptidase S8/S53 domain-containing protein n=1 Tax=Apodospora peruviana TaxID=516989 RepID=A0AAE0IRF6_9PEZI|nr:peptidase S8/S53 domain-containing protein [Apodospora peruviana]